MPHSSGGGSHGGGSHGGSHGGSRRGGSRGNSRRVGKNYFAGASRYVYYQNHQPVYVYANYDITKKSSKARLLLLAVYIPFLLAVCIMFFGAFHAPEKLSLPYDMHIVVDDTIGVLDDESTVEETLRSFRDKTGIVPAIITVYNEDWQGRYQSLENYAYDLYVNTFTDEQHWLIVYSQPKEAEESFVDWYWEGMQGDDTDAIITQKAANRFNAKLQEGLTANSRYTVSEAFVYAFEDTTSSIMESYINWGEIVVALGVGLFIALHMYLMVFFDPGNKKEYQEASPCPTYVQEETCEYCNGVYVVGTCISCPHCGAPVKPHSYHVDGTQAGVGTPISDAHEMTGQNGFGG